MSWTGFFPVIISEQQILLSFMVAGKCFSLNTTGGLDLLSNTHTLQPLSSYPESYNCADFASPGAAACDYPAVPLFICHSDYTPFNEAALKIHQTLAISPVRSLSISACPNQAVSFSPFPFLQVSEGEMPYFSSKFLPPIHHSSVFPLP